MREKYYPSRELRVARHSNAGCVRSPHHRPALRVASNNLYELLLGFFEINHPKIKIPYY